MLNVRPGLGITTHRSRIGSSLIEPSRLLSRRKNIHLSVEINALVNPLPNGIEPLVKHSPLIRWQSLRFAESAESQIGWNSWQPTRVERIASTLKVDRAELDSPDDREIDADNLDSLTTIFNSTSDDDLSSGLAYLDREDGGESVVIFHDNKTTEFASESRSTIPKISNQIDRQESNSTAVGDRTAPPINDLISSEIID
ncbi:MAG: hypothetical protein LH474_11815, partial [Chamaesiphon sp.]|nr:hypothetical protein [Chamaesiphon sp.]